MNESPSKRSLERYPGEAAMVCIWNDIMNRKKSQDEVDKEQLEKLNKNPIFAKIR